jgi:hypothetical protein
MLLPDNFVNAFNAISTIHLSTFHYWFLALSAGFIILLTLLIVGLSIYQLQATGEINVLTFLLTMGGLIFALAVFLAFLAV